MAKYLFLNDTGENLVIHGGSGKVLSKNTDKGIISHGETVVVEYPSHFYPWVKVWKGVVLLSSISPEVFKEITNET